MFTCTFTGNLVEMPSPIRETASGVVVRIYVGFNQHVYDLNVRKYNDVKYLGFGLIYEDRIKHLYPYLYKGIGVIVSAKQFIVSTKEDQNRLMINLGYLIDLHSMNLDRGKEKLALPEKAITPESREGKESVLT